MFFAIASQVCAELPPPPATRFQSGTWGKMPAEDTLTSAIAGAIASSPNAPAKVWTASATHPRIQAAGAAASSSWLSPFFMGHSEVDLGWSARIAPRPDAVVEIKKRSSAAASQDHYAILMEIAAVGAEILHAGDEDPLRGGVLFVAPDGERSRTSWLSCLVPQSGVLSLSLQPSVALHKGGPAPKNAPYWANPVTGRVAPDHRSAFNKIIGRSTSAKLIGLFRRPGTFEVQCDVEEVRLPNGYWLLYFEVTRVALDGGGESAVLADWWP